MFRSLLVFVLIPLALVGCGQSPQEKARDGNQKISRMNNINSAVASTYGIVLSSSSSNVSVEADNDFMLDRLSSADLRSLQAQVQEFRNLASDVIKIIDSGDVSGGDRTTLDRAARNADHVLASIASRLAQAA